MVRLPILIHHSFYHDEPERRKWQNPEKILDEIGLKQGHTFIDVGCGDGFFTLPAARLVGAEGSVYGIDIDEDAIHRIRRKAADEDVKNLTLRVGEAENTVLCDACGDVVFFGIVLHDFNDATKVLENSRRMLKPTGRLVDLDWKKESMPLGPPYQIRFSQKKATELIRSAGFEIEKTTNSGLYHYMIIGKLPSST